MCGIVGIKFDCNDPNFIYAWLTKSLIISSRRGRDSCGLSIVIEEGDKVYLKVFKSENGPKETLKDKSIFNFIKKTTQENKKISFIIAHTRLATNGDTVNFNNQPLINDKENCSLVFNGIICNSKEILNEQNFKAKTLNDGEALWCIDSFEKKIKGNYSYIKILGNKNTLISYLTNNGSLYEADDPIKGIKKLILSEQSFFLKLGIVNFIKNKINQKYVIEINNQPISKTIIENIIVNKSIVKVIDIKKAMISEKVLQKVDSKIQSVQNNIIRCSKCILPNTHPFIYFDKNGVCNFCLNYKTKKLKPKKNLVRKVEKYNSQFGGHSILCALSGGRDSSYAAHLLVNDMNIKPITYTYDWGLNTDIARRNVSIISGELGLENILISADLRKKRENVKKNILAWLSKPHLGIVPLFMAGDKQFISNANILKKELNIKLEIFATNSFETTQFKEEFCGFELWDKDNSHNPTKMKFSSQLKMVYFYLTQFISNRKYINISLLDTFLGFLDYYHFSPNIIEIYNYYDWDEEKINNTLINKYGWETANDTTSTWRIGDGTQPFYNFIYYIFKGFTENDTLRSFLIRENKISREKALEITIRENYPRYDTLNWYCSLFDLDTNLIIEKIVDKSNEYIY